MNTGSGNRRDERLAKELERHSPPLPPWLRFPDIKRGSINWNMGDGEDYIGIWELWISSVSQDDVFSYYEQFSPIPNEWVDWVAYRLFDDYDGDADEIFAERLANRNLVNLQSWREWHSQFQAE